MAPTMTIILSALAASASAGVIERAAACSSYTIIDTRGTGELQGPSAGFQTMNSNIRSAVPGGKEYDTVYAADASQDSTAGTTDIVNHIHSVLATSPNECFILEGYSQGAAATVNALPKLTGASFTAVKGVFLIGDPERKAGLACNVDQNGGTTTKNVNGLETFGSGGIPSNWVSKTLDVCNYGDGVCDTTHGYGIDEQHLAYPTLTSVQTLGTTFVEGKLKGTS
ncbi:hypothetical protein LTR62_007695 [Meristemomyces frigidus]|uniref:Cutinase n=1 Tax=Meristemomyces frigidus TaxID=1508187 RepID=A0AAN7TBS6_9PEZI|nr:hypothetical protein LTR62_007695 [Meristemomyces frigidus]